MIDLLVCAAGFRFFFMSTGDPTLVRQQLQQHADRAANAWSLGTNHFEGFDSPLL